MKQLSISLFALLTIVAPISHSALAQAPADKQYTLVAKFTTGEVLNYDMVMKMSTTPKSKDAATPIPAMEMLSETPLRMKTAGVKPDGTGTLVYQIVGGKMTMNGNEMPMPQTPAITLSMTPQGKVSFSAASAAVPGLDVMTQMMGNKNLSNLQMFLPDHPVKVGDKWQGEIAMADPTKPAKVECELISAEGEGDKETVTIKQVVTLSFIMGIGKDGKPGAVSNDSVATITSDMKSTGTVQLFTSNARISSSKTETLGSMLIKLSDEAATQSPIGKEFAMDIAGGMDMTLKSVGKAEAPAAKPATKPRPKTKKP